MIERELELEFKNFPPEKAEDVTFSLAALQDIHDTAIRSGSRSEASAALRSLGQTIGLTLTKASYRPSLADEMFEVLEEQVDLRRARTELRAGYLSVLTNELNAMEVEE
ncbi:hypothetical protein KY385_04495 [Candidatus Parcubacteria bacterium]|nr:hypothetical protein [Candidatus Parcubacteria bacterium]